MKRTISLFLAAIMLLTHMPLVSLAEETIVLPPIAENMALDGTCGQNVTWTLNNAGTFTISGTGDMFAYEGEGDIWWGRRKSNIRRVVVEDGVTSIAAYSFNGCENLTSVVLADSVRSIGSSAFSGCSNLSSFVMSDGIKSIGGSAFYGCTKLQTTKSGNAEYLGSASNPYVVLLKATSAQIKSCAPAQGTHIIAPGAFQNCVSLSSFEFSAGIAFIGSRAFAGCVALTSVTLPEGLERLDYAAFENCEKLKTVRMPESPAFVSKWAFDGCPVSYNTYGGGKYLGSESNPYLVFIEPIDEEATSLAFSSDTKVIADGACRGAKLTSLSFPKGLVIIGDSAFTFCSGIKKVIVPDSVVAIGDYAFGATGLTSASIPDSVISFGSDVFNSCASLTEVTLGAGITFLGWDVFNSCESLQTVAFKSPITFIGHRAFNNCRSLTTIYYGGTEEQWKTVYLEISAFGTSYNGAVEDAEIIFNCEEAPQTTIFGDANGDGEVNNKDIVRLKNYFANFDDETGLSTVELFPGADANGDGEVNNKDIVRLKNYFANYDDETGLSTVTLGPAA